MMAVLNRVRRTPGEKAVVPKWGFVFKDSASQAGGNVIMRVPHGETVSVLAPLGSWTKVRYGSNVGYMMSWFLK